MISTKISHVLRKMPVWLFYTLIALALFGVVWSVIVLVGVAIEFGREFIAALSEDLNYDIGIGEILVAVIVLNIVRWLIGWMLHTGDISKRLRKIEKALESKKTDVPG